MLQTCQPICLSFSEYNEYDRCQQLGNYIIRGAQPMHSHSEMLCFAASCHFQKAIYTPVADREGSFFIGVRRRCSNTIALFLIADWWLKWLQLQSTPHKSPKAPSHSTQQSAPGYCESSPLNQFNKQNNSDNHILHIGWQEIASVIDSAAKWWVNNLCVRWGNFAKRMKMFHLFGLKMLNMKLVSVSRGLLFKFVTALEA